MPQFGIVMFENASRTTAMAQTKFASVDAAYASYRAYEGTSKPSLPDYVALTSGQYSGKGSFGGNPAGADAGSVGFAGSQANILNQLATAGFSWKTYEEGVAVNGYSHWGTSGDANYATALYLARHCPAAFYTTTSSAGTSHGTGRYDFDELAHDITNTSLPDFFIVTPNAVHCGHDSGVGAANTWLTSGGTWGGIDNLIAAMRPGGLLALTFDNVPNVDTTVPITGTGVVYMVIAGQGVTHTADSTTSNHFSLLKAVQGFFGVSTFSTSVDSNYTAASAITLPGGGGGGGGGGAGPAPLVTVAYNNSNPRFVNAAGDQILLRGVNLLMTAPTSFGPLAVSMGLNMVRLVCNWDRFEATAPTGSGTNYSNYVHTLTASELSALDSFASYFASQGVYMQIDFAQAGWSPYFGGSGVPTWYYTDSRFKTNQNGGAGWSTAQQSNAIAAWWTDSNEKPMAQTLYNAWAVAMVNHVTSKSWSDHVVGWEVFNEPNPGSMSGSSAAKTSILQGWLSSTVDAIRAADSSRVCFVMCHGGGQGYGTAVFTDAFGSIATMQSKKLAMEYHSYYTGGTPGKNASAAGDVGYGAAVNNDDYFPDSNSCHNTVAGSSYHGTLAGQRAFMSVPIAKAAAIGLPMFQGEFNARFDDPGRLTYQQHVQQVFDENKLSCTSWKLGSTPTDSLGLVTNGALNDQGQSLAAWFKATNFIISGGGGGGGTGPTLISPPELTASTLVDGQTVGYTQGTWSGAATITDVFQLSADGSTGWATVGGTGPSGTASIVKNIGSTSSTTNSTTLTITTTGAVAAGNHVIVKAFATGSATLTSISGGGLSWQVDKANGSGTRTASIASAYAPSGLASGTLLTLTFSASVSRKIGIADEATGLATSSWVDQTSMANGSSSSPTSGALTTTTGDLIVNATAVTPPSAAVSTSDWTAGTGYTKGATVEVGANAPFLAAWDERIFEPSTGTYTPASTTGLGTVSWATASVAYKAATVTNGSNGLFTVPNDGSDDGMYLRVLETATDAQSNVATTSSIVVGPIGASISVPVCTTQPKANKTTMQTGQTVTWTPGVWTNTPTSHTYAIQRRQTGSSTILSTTPTSGTTYTALSSDVGYDIRFEEIETNAAGDGTPAFSPWTSMTGPTIVIFPTITLTTPPSDISLITTAGTAYQVSGTATSDTAITTCYVNSQVVSVDPTTGAFTRTISLSDGANLVTIVATDADGQTSTLTNTITVTEPSTGGGGGGDTGGGGIDVSTDLLRIQRELSERGLE